MESGSQKEHEWLQKLVGEWTSESEAVMEPGKPPVKHTAKESVRSLGGIWILCEGGGQTPDGGTAMSVMTLGYDPVKKRYVGTFVASMMTHLWVYEGALDAAGKVLTLDTEGPSFTTEGKMGRYKDTIELKSDDHRVMTSTFLDDEGTWREVMKVSYTRTK